jgi:thiamine-phosphate pyrophosphorylase
METRRERLAAVRVYLVATPAAHGASWEAALGAALATGLVGMVQLREKTLDDAAYLARAGVVRALCDAHGAMFVVNDRVHLVEAARADGVHVGADDVPVETARATLGPERLVGLSTHDAAEVAGAAARGADHVGLGPCFPTRTKRLERAPGGAELVARCLPRAAGLPVFPIGGVTPENVEAVAAAGRAAVGAGVLEAPDPAEAVRRIDAALRRFRPGGA